VLEPVVFDVSVTLLLVKVAETGDVESPLKALAKAEATDVVVLLLP
jgi:hypothetical protein